MSYIEVNNLCYHYQVYQKQSGFKFLMKDIFKRQYENKDVLQNISFQIKKGEKVGLLGPNGSGKSTLIKLLTGILTPDAGEISVANTMPNTNNNHFLNKIGVVMGQKSQLNWNLPAEDTFLILKSIYKISDQDYHDRLSTYLNMFQLEKVVSVPVRKLSLGERTKLEVIAALLHNPEILILDEPTIGMDIVSQHALHQFINQINKEKGVTILLISHQMSDIEAVADRLLILLNGQITFNGVVADFLKTTQLPSPQLIIEHEANKSPILESQETAINHKNTKTIISNYNGNSLVTLKIQDIQKIKVENPSLEDTLYQLFKDKENNK